MLHIAVFAHLDGNTVDFPGAPTQLTAKHEVLQERYALQEKGKKPVPKIIYVKENQWLRLPLRRSRED